MPVAFDFSTTVPTGLFGMNPGPLVFSEVDTVGGAQTVTFTLSTNADGGLESVGIGVSGLQLFDIAPSTPDDVWTLRFQDTSVTGNNQLSGTASNRVSFNVGGQTGSVAYDFLTASGTVAGGMITASGLQQAPSSLDGVGILGIRFSASSTGDDGIEITLVTANELNCFLAGTRIATPEGAVAVENITAGDQVLTADGRAVEVHWLGKQFVDTRVVHPAKVNPVCISAGALAEGVPERDLYVSPDHAIELDGYLINAGALVNGSTIYQVAQMPLDGFTYYHVETDAHELLLAEGCPAESFVDYASLDDFENADERDGQVIPEMPLSRISASRLVPEHITRKLRPLVAAE